MNPALLSLARQLDSADELAPFRGEFHLPDPTLIYLDGNSLGRLPRGAVTLLAELVEQGWGGRLIRGWNEGWWMELQTRIGDKIARLTGASAGEIIIADSTSINLYKLAHAALRLRPGRAKIVTDDLNFPSDLYILQGICRQTGAALHIVPSADGIHGNPPALAAALDQDTALLTLSHTVFKSGYTYDMAALTGLAHAAGALTLWDLSHSAGSVPVPLNAARADLAVGCTYKYLNGGPGAPAFLYIRQDLQHAVHNPITGWIGQDAPFDFGLDYRPAPGLRRMLTGTPGILSTAAIEPGVDLLLAAGLERLRKKSLAQTDYFIQLYQAELAPRGYALNSPLDASRRGSHLSLAHPEGYGIDLALIHEMNVLPDFRPPDNIRLGIAPIYTTFTELYEAASRLAQIVDGRLYEKYRGAQVAVT
jgi:kynureninase